MERNSKVKIISPCKTLFKDIKANECFKVPCGLAGYMKVDVPGYPNAVVNLHFGNVELTLFDTDIDRPVILLKHEVHIQDAK